MSVDQALRKMIRNEVGSQLRPISQAVAQLGVLREIGERLAPLAGLFGGALPVVRRGPGRPPGSVKRGRGRPPKVGGRAGDRRCALIGCGKPSRTKGYCAAHYQKLRMLIRTNRRPAAWVDHAAPNSVADVVLPRGRAGSKALRALRAKARAGKRRRRK